MRQQTRRGNARSDGSTLVERALGTPGKPLDERNRRFFETRFHHDFSRIRVHDDRESDAANRRLGARAFTRGEDIAFRKDAYQPATLGHELLHTLETAGEEKHASRTTPVVQMDALTERQKIEAALQSKDNDDVQAIRDFTQASKVERLQLIRILVEQWWVGPDDEDALERIWSTFGDELPSVISKHRDLWNLSIEGGADLDPLLAGAKSTKTALEAATKRGSGASLGETGRAFTRLADLSHDLSVLETGRGTYEGNKCATVTPGVTRSDCTEFVLEILRKTFTQQGREADWKKVEAKISVNQKRRAGPKMSGLDVQAALQSEAGWRGVYWAPDPKYQIPAHELAGKVRSDEASYSSTTAKQGTYYKDFGKKGYPGVSVSQMVTNYAPERPASTNPAGYPGASTTSKDLTGLEKLKKVPFGVLSAHGGYHMTIITKGKVIEVHQSTTADNADVIEQTNLEDWARGSMSGYHYYASGVIVAPAEDIRSAFGS